MILNIHHVLLGNFLTNHNINWWKTPAESPDMNPIEDLWHELKEYIQCEVKPRNKEDLINEFWASVHIHKCCRYINHLRKVLPKVIEVHGEPTGYSSPPLERPP